MRNDRFPIESNRLSFRNMKHQAHDLSIIIYVCTYMKASDYTYDMHFGMNS